MIYIIGDTHGEIEHYKLGNKYFKKQGLEIPTSSDTLIHVGDLGFVWDQEDNIKKPEQYLKKWSGQKPWTMITAGGNHENWDRILSLPKVPWPGGELAYKYTDNVYYALRGGVYEIEGKTFFLMGGATSIDVAYRTDKVSWWEDEIPSLSEMEAGVAALDAVNMEVDYVVTHTFPWEVVHMMGFYNIKTCPMTSYLNQLVSFGLKFKKWFGGHFHIDRVINNRHGEFHCLYDTIYRIDD